MFECPCSLFGPPNRSALSHSANTREHVRAVGSSACQASLSLPPAIRLPVPVHDSVRQDAEAHTVRKPPNNRAARRTMNHGKRQWPFKDGRNGSVHLKRTRLAAFLGAWVAEQARQLPTQVSGIRLRQETTTSGNSCAFQTEYRVSTSNLKDMAIAPLIDRVPDDELLRQVAAGDASAFAELFGRRHADVFRFAWHMTASVSTAEDVVQDVFLVLMRDAQRYEAGRATVVAWLCGIARNCVRQRLDRDRRLEPFDVAGEHEPASDAGGALDPLADLIRTERIETLRRAVHTLPVPYREALVLCDLQEMTYGDAAKVLACPVGTVRSRLHRARALLAAKLSAAGLSAPVSRAVAQIGNPAAEPGQGEYAGRTRPGGADAGGCYV